MSDRYQAFTIHEPFLGAALVVRRGRRMRFFREFLRAVACNVRHLLG